MESTISLTLLAKDLASGNIQKVAVGLDDIQKKSTLAGTVVKGAGVLAAGGFALMAKGALEAQDAQGKFMAATGASREEAKQFVSEMDGLAGSVGTVGMKFDEIAQLGTTVAQQFGTTGQATQDLTELIAEFAKVTGQDANQAAGDLEDTLSAYGLSAQDAAGFTDMLVASAQKYGTEVGPAQLDIIRKISPALQTMGGDINDAVGFLNAMEVAGIDATDAQKGFNTALSNVPPGTTIDDLVKHFSDLKSKGIDPTAEAIQIFGAKAGPALLKAIQPGMDGLDDLAVSADDATGAVHDGATAMVTDADKIKGAFEKLMAGAREVGQDFGPAIMGLASLGTLVAPLAKGLSGVWSSIGSPSSPVTAAAKAAGQFTGLSWALAAEATIATGGLALIAGAAEGVLQQLPVKGGASDPLFGPIDWSKRGHDAGVAGGTAAADAATTAFQTTTQDYFGAGHPFITAAGFNSFQQQATAGGTDVGTALVTSAGKAAADAAPEVFQKAGHAAAVGFTGTAADDLRESKVLAGVANVLGRDTAQAYALGLAQTQGDVQSAFETFQQAMKHPMTVQKEMAELNGELTSKALQKGLQSGDPLIRAQAEAMRDQIQARIDDLKKLAADDGSDASSALAKNLDGSAAVAKAIGIANAINAKLGQIDTSYQIYINRVTGTPDKQAKSHAKGGHMDAHEPGVIGEEGPEFWVPDAAGTVIPLNTTTGVSGLSGSTNINVSFPSLIPYSGAQMAEAARSFIPELVREMRRQRLLPQGGF